MRILLSNGVSAVVWKQASGSHLLQVSVGEPYSMQILKTMYGVL